MSDKLSEKYIDGFKVISYDLLERAIDWLVNHGQFYWHDSEALGDFREYMSELIDSVKPKQS